MTKLKVATIVGTRPEIIKLSEVIKELDKHTKHVIIHTGQNYDYELNEIFFNEMGIRKPDIFLDAAKGSASETIGNIISKAEKSLKKVKPDAVLIYGDTNSCLSVISAKRNKIPIFHMEAGNRCFDQRVPEEINRKIVDHLSDINLPLSEHARNYLISEGIKPETIIKIGSPMKEVLNSHIAKINSSKILKKEKVKSNKYIIMSIHREENIDDHTNFKNLLDAIDLILKTYQIPVIISTHPRTKNKLEEIGYKNKSSMLNFAKPYGFHDYIKLQMEAFCVISDSGTLSEEASLLNLPAITIRQAHERPESMDETSIIMSGLNKNRVIQAIEIATKHNSDYSKKIQIVKDYNVENVSKKVLRIILSYVDYINRTVWHK
jgi:UDP-N-acetylglucosamine 2-epimerase (non-hydrolysing)